MNRNIILKTLIFWLLCQLANGQTSSCKIENSIFSSTNPLAPIPLNPPASEAYKTNTFDWRQNTFPYLNNYCAQPGFAGQLLSPFYDPASSLATPNRRVNFGDNSDYRPEEGWELLKRDFGYFMKPGQMINPPPAGVANSMSNTNMAYMILYNRQSAIIRVFATLPTDYPMANGIEISLSFRLYQNLFSVSNLLSASNAMQHSLNEVSTIDQNSSWVPNPTNCNLFFYSDFPVAYDPCTCIFPSDLKVQFKSIMESTFTASGPITGFSQEIGQYYSRTSPPYGSPSQDFRQSYYQTVFGKNATSSFLSGKMDKMYAGYMQKAQEKDNFEAAAIFAQLAKFAKYGNGVGATEDGLEFIIDTWNYVSEDGEQFGLKNETKAANALLQGKDPKTIMEGAARLFEALGTSNNKTGSSKNMPWVIEAEVSLQGTVIANQQLVNQIKTMTNPGSRNSENAPECCDLSSVQKYDRPTYNEVLGLFALKSTPVIGVSYNYKNPKANSTPFAQNFPNSYVIQDLERRYSLVNNLEYFINPAAKVDLTLTTVKAAMVVRTPHYISTNPDGVYLSDLFLPVNNLNYGSVNDFVTPFMEPSCLNSITPYLRFPWGIINTFSDAPLTLPQITDDKVFVKFYIHYVFKDRGRNGELRSYDQVLTYPTTKYDSRYNTTGFINIPQTGYQPTSPRFINIDGNNNNFTTNTLLFAWDVVKITETILLSPGVSLEIVTTKDIIVSPEVEIPVGVTLRIDKVNPSCFYQNLHITDRPTIDAFCNSSNYKAKICTSCLREDEEIIPRTALEVLASFSLHPNPAPTGSTVDICFSKPLDQEPKVQMIDAIGRQIVFRQEMQGNCLRLSPGTQARGLYILQISVGKQSTYKRLVIE